MENVFFTAEPLIALMFGIITIALIVIGRKLELPYLPVTVVAYGLGLLVYHTVAINLAVTTDLTLYYFSVAIDMVILFLGFITYLWVDNIVAKNKNKKSYSDAMSWFWDKL